MNENHVIQCIQRVFKRIMNKYVILAAIPCSLGHDRNLLFPITINL
jgi:hypothetical protein